jgi:hypothetical protein
MEASREISSKQNPLSPDQTEIMGSVRIPLSSDQREENQMSSLSTQFASAIQIDVIDNPTTIGRPRYYNDLVVGNTFQGRDIPHIHRAVSLPESRESLVEHSEYVMVNKITGMLQYYDADEISSQIASILGISVLVLREYSFSGVGEDVRHGVLHSSHLGQPCFVAPSLEDGLCLALYEEFKLRCGYHALVVPVEAMTLDDFIARFGRRENWSICRG